MARVIPAPFAKILAGTPPRKVIYVPQKLVNIVPRDDGVDRNVVP
jgi:hypothetical protein